MALTNLDPTNRFSNRADSYVRFRPGYPVGLLAVLARQAGLDDGARVADIGSGTGIFTALLLDRGFHVLGVEPNPEMRKAAQERFGRRDHFESVDGAAEATGLGDASLDLITCAQAFHWVDVAAAAREFRRLLRPGGTVALVWNLRQIADGGFGRDYHDLILDYALDVEVVGDESGRAERAAIKLFGVGNFVRHVFANAQSLDREALEGRILSASYMPNEAAAAFTAMRAAIHALYDRHQSDGAVEMGYDTVMYLGQLA